MSLTEAPTLIVFGAVEDHGIAAHMGRQIGLRVWCPGSTPGLVAALERPFIVGVVLVPPLPSGECMTLGAAIRKLHPGVPVAVALGKSALEPELARTMWLTARPIAPHLLRIAAEIGALAVEREEDEAWDRATNDVIVPLAGRAAEGIDEWR